jgi:ADP-ribosylglycohydrolase
MSTSVEDRVAGSLLGLAAGDALGLPLDGLTVYHVYRLYHAEIDGYFPDNRREKKTQAGTYGPQTFCAMVTAKHLAAGLTLENLAAAEKVIAENQDRSKYEYQTHLSRAVALGLAAGAVNLDAPGLRTLIKAMREQSSMDWLDSLCCLCVASVICELVARPDQYKGPFDLYDGKQSLLARICESCRIAENSHMEREKMVLREELSARLESTRHKLRDTDCNMTRFVGIHGSGSDLPEIVASSFYSYMRAPDSHETMFSAVSVGGAASLRGSLVGAMVGATLGLSIFPPGLKDDVINGPKIIETGVQLVKALGPKEPI